MSIASCLFRPLVRASSLTKPFYFCAALITASCHMRNNTCWVIVDVETDGLYEPIHVVLKECFRLPSRQSHRAENDVLTVADLFQQVYKPRLEPAALDTFESIARFSKRTPVAKCRELIRAASPKR